MAIIVNEGGRLSTRSSFVSNPFYSNVSDVVDFTINDAGSVFCTHASGRISVGNGITQNYLQTDNGFATFPISSGNIGLIYAGYFNFTSGTRADWLATPGGGGLVFISILSNSATIIGTSYTVDPDFPIAGFQGLSGVSTGATTADGSGIWNDLAYISSNGDLAFLNQSSKAQSSIPYFDINGVISNNWYYSDISNVVNASRMTSPSPGVFAFPFQSSSPGSSIGFSNWPNLLPAVAATRNFESFTVKANPYAFESDGVTPKANWNSFAVSGIESYGSLVMVSGPDYVYSMSIG